MAARPSATPALRLFLSQRVVQAVEPGHGSLARAMTEEAVRSEQFGLGPFNRRAVIAFNENHPVSDCVGYAAEGDVPPDVEKVK